MKRPAAAPPRNYLNAITSLRDSVERNRKDANFASQDGNEIVYIIDANVFIFHADILDNSPLTRNFNYIVDNPAGNSISEALERLTARFLFSGHLPGQKNQESFITLPHFEEVLRKSEKIAKRYERGFDRWTTISLQEDAEAVRKSMSTILGLEASAQDRLELLAEVVPKAWIANLNASGHFTDAIEKAFLKEPAGLVPLDRRDWGQEAAKVRADGVAAWRKVLPKASATRFESSLQDDAETLETIVNLYRATQPPAGEERKTLYVLITADRSLATAVEKRAADLRKDGIEDFIRSPQDYLPLLNLTAMSEALDSAELDSKTRREFKKVFDELSTALDLAVAAAADWTYGPEAWTSVQLKRAWVEFSKYITVLSLRHYHEGVDLVFKELAKFVGSSAGTKSATKSAERSVIDVRDRHLDIVIESALAALAKTRPSTDQPPPRRANILIGSEVFGALLGGELDVIHLLDRAVQRGALPSETMKALRDDPSSPEAQVLAACLFVAAERWESATQFAARAHNLLLITKRTIDFNEASYLLALCLRFSMRTAYDFEHAQRLLEGNIRRHAGQRRRPVEFLRGIRDEMELGSLLLTAAVTQEIARNVPGVMAGERNKITLFPSHTANTQLRAGVDRIRRARENLIDNQGVYPHGSRREHLSASLSWIALANLVGAFIFERIVPGLQSGTPIIGDDITRYVYELENEIVDSKIKNRKVSPTRDIYLATAKALTQGDARSRAKALLQLDSILTDVATHGATLPLGDRLEFACISRWLNRERALVADSAFKEAGYPMAGE